jgi:hypothetical protein
VLPIGFQRGVRLLIGWTIADRMSPSPLVS